MLYKIILLIVVIAVVYVMFFKRKLEDKSKNLEDTQECTECKTYVTQEDSILKNNKVYCSAECLQ